MFSFANICLPLQNKCLGHSNVFICFASFENPKTYQPAREKNKQEKIKNPCKYFRTVFDNQNVTYQWESSGSNKLILHILLGTR
jgi:hypothetical protein